MRWIRAAYEVKAYRWSGSADAVVNGRWEPEPGDSFEVQALRPWADGPIDAPMRWKASIKTNAGYCTDLLPGSYIVSDPLIEEGFWRPASEARVRERYQQLTPPAA